MSISFIFFAFKLGFAALFCSFSTAYCLTNSNRNLSGETSCPLNFDLLREIVTGAPWRPSLTDVPSRCGHVIDGIRYVRSAYLQTNGYFFPPPATAPTCWDTYQNVVDELSPDFDIQTHCGYHPEWFWQGCGNITSREQFENRIPASEMDRMRLSCNQSLENSTKCESCTNILSSTGKMYLDGSGNWSAMDCSVYMFMYAAASVNQLGLTDQATTKCLLRLQFAIKSSVKKRHKVNLSGVVGGFMFGILVAFLTIWFVWTIFRKYGCKKNNLVEGEREKEKEKEKDNSVEEDETSLVFGHGLYSKSPNLVKFRIEEIKRATMNFSRCNIIGKGGYGNVYKGVLRDGTEVALKRFKNCSALGDANFEHELEIIASVRHVNLVALKGYCTATNPMEGHQRIIVCDLMHNGSLYDHLFETGQKKKKLSWPIRQKIALGTARGLCYLHYGVHPAIIHRDIKASNILLDETFEPKVADFGLAKFNNAAGMSHLSTRVAGTLGYVAPEYALYGKLTERSDVYSFGVLLLELLSGKKAFENNDGKPSLLADWAWSLVQQGKASDIIEKDMAELGISEVMEQYVYTATLCAHPILHARPTMDQIVNILEAETPTNPIPAAYLDSEPVSVGWSYMSSSSSINNDRPLISETMVDTEC
ncbi:putative BRASSINOSTEROID INSENSITIVE 1-associated receptor kinase 1 precursor [Tripterygium wilfordii]|uniref:non-specific serine/threonine protein kinase n=1 Tax=Tripterygium wilfordii TaxID=458696 RepID=A0A7J7CZG6_TRIWF|nr:probable LRR receptor-like serine/threonine-protein kinase RKF3 [Tripterygium wilfordii]KAF5739502.1 putative BRASSINOSTEROID INSENSITIVE 1-associated receptor kinase 1 precursor [Tripterygium wilfordii]